MFSTDNHTGDDPAAHVRQRRAATQRHTALPQTPVQRAEPAHRRSHKHGHRAEIRRVPAARRLQSAVRGRLGAHQHRLGQLTADAMCHRRRCVGHFRQTAELALRGRTRAGRLGSGQHCGRLARVSRTSIGQWHTHASH